MDKKHICMSCGGVGKVIISGPDCEYARGCVDCGGTGKMQITISLEEYDRLLKQTRPRINNIK